MGFSAEQRQALTAKLDGRVIRERVQAGQTLSYIEGWYAIAEANRVFGFEGWDRETVSLRCVWEGARQGRSACAYIAQVRIRVRAGDILVCRDGHGSGMGSGSSPGEAHETAVKEAETDATKRALVTFGNVFGLCLYDRAQKQVRRARRKSGESEWLLRSPAGDLLERFSDPARFCSALRRALERVASAAELVPTLVAARHRAGRAGPAAAADQRTRRSLCRDPGSALSQAPVRTAARDRNRRPRAAFAAHPLPGAATPTGAGQGASAPGRPAALPGLRAAAGAGPSPQIPRTPRPGS